MLPVGVHGYGGIEAGGFRLAEPRLQGCPLAAIAGVPQDSGSGRGGELSRSVVGSVVGPVAVGKRSRVNRNELGS